MRDPTHISPSPEQIAKFHALLHESESLTRQINAPVVSLSIAMTVELLRMFGANNIINIALGREGDHDNRPSWQRFFVAFIPLIALTSYVFYQTYQKVTSIFQSYFPSGINYTRPYSITKMQGKLGSRDELQQAIKALEALISAQKATRDRYYYFFLGINAIHSFYGTQLFMPSYFILKKSIDMLFGPVTHLLAGPSRAKDSLAFSINKLFVLMQNQTSFDFWRYTYRGWSNYNLPQQIKEYCSQLKNLGCLSAGSYDLSTVKTRHDSRDSVLILFKPRQENLTFVSESNTRYQISKTSYLIELHRVLIEEKVPVYHAGNNEIYIGFYDLNATNSKRIQQKLFNRLLAIEQHEKNSGHALRKLNENLPTIIKTECAWECYFNFDEPPRAETYYYINKKALREGGNIFNAYFTGLQKTLPECTVKFDGEVITIRHAKYDAFNSMKVDFIMPTVELPTPSSNVVRAKPSFSSSKQAPSSSEKISSNELVKKSPYPDRINFGSGVLFFKNAPTPKPDNFAYPFRPPWLAEGKAYASVDPDAIAAVSTYLTKEEVLNPFDKGEVVGPDEHKTNVIQSTNEPYQDVHGQDHFTSGYKAKWSNNIRMFAYNAGTVTVDDKKYIHYRFNGPGFGH